MAAKPITEAVRTAHARDAAVDLVKAFCLMVVVGMHVLMAGVTIGPDGLAVTNALAGHPIFAWATWGLQVMPLFFLLGGFSSITQWRRMRADGATDADYIRLRVNRLARPAILPIALVGGTLAVVALSGYPAHVLADIGFRIGQPLWFLAVYLGCCAFVPLMTRLHERAPLVTIGTLLGAALVIDTVSVTFALPGVNALNFLFVWLFIQQLGFFVADGAFARLPRWALLAIGVGAYGVLVGLTLGIGYSTDMYDNLNPPTTCIVVLGVGQVFLVMFARPWLDRLATPRLIRAAAFVNRNSMTIYLWHVPVVVLIALAMIATGMAMPEPLSGTWWQTRPLFMAGVLVALSPVILLLARWERRRTAVSSSARRTPAVLAAVKVLLAVSGIAVILLVGFTPVVSWAIAMVLLTLAVLIGPLPLRTLAPKPRQKFD